MDNKRFFLALWPDDRQRNTLRDTFRPLLTSIEGTAVDRRNWHVTLVFIGDLPQSRTSELLSIIADVEVQPFRLRFDRLSFLPRPKIACLEASTVPDELKRLKQNLETLLLPFGVEPESFEYRPHITAVRQARSFETIRQARPVELLWTGFELVESISMPGGVQYRPLKQ